MWWWGDIFVKYFPVIYMYNFHKYNDLVLKKKILKICTEKFIVQKQKRSFLSFFVGTSGDDIKWNISRKSLFLLSPSVQMSAQKLAWEMSGELMSGCNRGDSKFSHVKIYLWAFFGEIYCSSLRVHFQQISSSCGLNWTSIQCRRASKIENSPQKQFWISFWLLINFNFNLIFILIHQMRRASKIESPRQKQFWISLGLTTFFIWQDLRSGWP